MTEKKKFQVPHSMAIIVAAMILASILTYLIPGGNFERVVNDAGKTVVVPGSFTYVEQTPGQSAYSATKGAIMAFTRSAAKELASQGIRVNAVAPGIVKTERFSELYEESGEKIDTRIQKIALGRLGTPEDVANACAFLVSDRSSYISGQILGVDGCASI